MPSFFRREKSSNEPAGLTLVQARLSKGDVLPEDFERLARSLPEQFTNELMKAKSAFLRSDLAEAGRVLGEVRSTCARQNARLGGGSETPPKARPARADSSAPLATRREKAAAVLRDIEDVLAAVKQIEAQGPRAPAIERARAAATQCLAATPSELVLAFTEHGNPQARRHALKLYGRLRPVAAEQIDDGLYVLSADNDLAMAYGFYDRHGGEILMLDVTTLERRGKLSLDQFVELGSARRVARLELRPAAEDKPRSGTAAAHDDSPYCLLEGREFKQLLSSMERTGFTLRTDLVKQAQIEFMAKNYEDARAKLLAFGGEFERAAATWMQKCREKVEKYDRERGGLMSAGKWQAEQAADRVTNEKITSARRSLALVTSALEAIWSEQRKA